MKAHVLQSAYQIAINKSGLEGTIHFEKCCKEAIERHKTTAIFGVKERFEDCFDLQPEL